MASSKLAGNRNSKAIGFYGGANDDSIAPPKTLLLGAPATVKCFNLSQAAVTVPGKKLMDAAGTEAKG